MLRWEIGDMNVVCMVYTLHVLGAVLDNWVQQHVRVFVEDFMLKVIRVTKTKSSLMVNGWMDVCYAHGLCITRARCGF